MFQHDWDRIVLTDHGAFVLLNVYVPNAGDRTKNGGERAGFKCRFLAALKEKADNLLASGREVTWPLTHIAMSGLNTGLPMHVATVFSGFEVVKMLLSGSSERGGRQLAGFWARGDTASDSSRYSRFK
jgi:hypothetical protein